MYCGICVIMFGNSKIVIIDVKMIFLLGNLN